MHWILKNLNAPKASFFYETTKNLAQVFSKQSLFIRAELRLAIICYYILSIFFAAKRLTQLFCSIQLNPKYLILIVRLSKLTWQVMFNKKIRGPFDSKQPPLHFHRPLMGDEGGIDGGFLPQEVRSLEKNLLSRILLGSTS